MVVKLDTKTKIGLTSVLALFCIIAVYLLSAPTALALGYSSTNYNMSVVNLDASGQDSDSSNYNTAEMLDWFATGKFTSTNYIVKAGYLYFKPPNAPAIGTPVPLSTSSILWNFTDQSADEEGFLLEDEDETVTLVEEQANISSLTETGLDENQRYTRRVLAFNPFGNSIPSDSATTCTFVAPRNLTGTPGTTYMDLYMDSFPRDTVGSSAYYVLFQYPGYLWDKSANGYWRYENLSVNTSYSWVGKVVNICGVGSSEVSFTACTLANTPGQPVISYSENNGYYTANVAWNANGNPVGTEYAVVVNGSYLQLDGSLGGNPAWSTSLSRPHYGLSLDTTYVYRVMARNCDNIETDLSLPGALYISLGKETKEKTVIEEIISTLPEFVANIVKKIIDALKKFRDNPLTQLINQVAVVPALTALALANLLAAAGLANIGSLLSSLWHAFTEPFLLFAGRRRRFWGVVYNSATKVPVDLALVRLLEVDTGKLVSTRVTDRQGRFSFLAKMGKYKITVTKEAFNFPSKRVAGKTHDVGYDDLYFGEDLNIENKETVITVSIPVDPVAEVAAVETSKGAIGRYLRRRASIFIALIGPVLAAVCLWISPNIYTFLFLCLHLLILTLFARAVFGKKGKPWGTVYDAKSGKPIGMAVVRIYSKKYGDLLETQVTDRRGRFGFLVGPETYRLTSEKPEYSFPSSIDKGFRRYRGEDFTVRRDGLVKFDIPMDPTSPSDKNITSSSKPPSLPPSQFSAPPETKEQVEEKKNLGLGELGGSGS